MFAWLRNFQFSNQDKTGQEGEEGTEWKRNCGGEETEFLFLQQDKDDSGDEKKDKSKKEFFAFFCSHNFVIRGEEGQE